MMASSTQHRRLRPGRWLLPPLLTLLIVGVLSSAESLVLVVAAGGACVLVWLGLTVLRRPLAWLSRRTGVARLTDAMRRRRGLGTLLALGALATSLALLLPVTRPASAYVALTLLTALAAGACVVLRIDREITSWNAWFASLGGRAVGGVAIVCGCLLAALAAGDAASVLPWPAPPPATRESVFIPADPDNEAILESYGAQRDFWRAVSATAALERLAFGPPPRPPLEHWSVERARSYLASADRSVLRLVEGMSATERGLVPLPTGDDHAMLSSALERAEQGDDPLLAYRIAVMLGDARLVPEHEDAAAQRVATAPVEQRAAFERARAAFHLRRGELARAITGYEAALAFTPKQPYVLCELAMTLLLERERLLAGADDGREGASTLDSGEADALLERARVAYVDALTRMDESLLSYTHALSNTGWVYSAMGDAQTAHAFYDRALARDRALFDQWPSQDSARRYLATPLANLGRVHLDLARYEAAAENFAQALAAQRSHWGGSHESLPPLLRQLGRAFEGAGRPDEAVDAYRQAVRIAQDLAGDWRERPPVGDPEALPEQDRAWLEAQIERRAMDELAPSLGDLVNCLARQRRFEEALEPAREALGFARWLLPEGDPVIAKWEDNVRMAEIGAQLEAQREAGGG